MNKILNFAVSDFKLVFRDPSLRFFLLMPVLIFLVVGPLLQYLVNTYPIVKEYASYVIMTSTLQASILFGFIYAMVFIDEKETDVNKVYAIVPASKSIIIITRLVVPTLVSIVLAFALLAYQRFYTFTFVEKLYCALVAGLSTPILALSVASLSKNKMEGLTWFKIVNSFATIPLLAFFVPKFKYLFTILPSHWLFQGMDLSIAGEQGRIFYLVGILYSLVLIYLLVRLFLRRQF